MSTKLPKVDAVVIGIGWTGGILAKEMTQAGLKVVGLERGRYHETDPDFQPPHIHDELRYHVRYDLMQYLSRETLTFRNTTQQSALPYRVLGSFLPSEGLRGAGVHWNGVTWRFLPYDFEIRSQTVSRYGKSKIPQDMSLQDWGVTYAELEPHYDTFEYTCGISGQAGNLKGKTVEGGNPFEGLRSRPYPTPALTPSYANTKVRQATESLGYHPFMQPAATLSQAYTNPDGVTQGACVYCGYCQRFGCEVYAKSSAITTVLPVAAQDILDTAYDSVGCRSIDPVSVTDIKVGTVLSQVHQRHQQLIFSAKFAWSARFAFLPSSRSQRLDHHLERFWLNSRQPFERL